MLPKKHRLAKHAEVNHTTAKGRSFFSKSFVIKFLSLKEAKTPQITVIVSNKVSKSAVVRNRLKRVIRQGIHEQVKDLKPGYYVFILKQLALTITSKELREELLGALKKNKSLQL